MAGMAFISVTRLRIRSVFFLPPFIWHALRSARLAQRSDGFLGGRLVRDAGNVFWTGTAWRDQAAMQAYRGAGVHRQVMPKLASWCDEASIAHWDQPDAQLPDWPQAHRRMLAEGRASKVNRPSSDHSQGRV